MQSTQKDFDTRPSVSTMFCGKEVMRYGEKEKSGQEENDEEKSSQEENGEEGGQEENGQEENGQEESCQEENREEESCEKEEKSRKEEESRSGDVAHRCRHAVGRSAHATAVEFPCRKASPMKKAPFAMAPSSFFWHFAFGAWVLTLGDAGRYSGRQTLQGRRPARTASPVEANRTRLPSEIRLAKEQSCL
jgi:hypothetical protein